MPLPCEVAIRAHGLPASNRVPWQALLDGGASTSAETYGGDTPIVLAQKYNQPKVSAVFNPPPKAEPKATE